MISDQRESEKLINDKFMKKIQSTTTIYEMNKPDTYDNIIADKNEEKNEVEEKQYRYLADEPLHKVIDEPMSNTEFHYVLYNIVDDITLPFVKILMCNDNNTIKFPNKKATIENIDDSSSNSDYSDSESDDIIPYEDNDDNSDIEISNLSEENVENDDEYYMLDQCSQYLEKTFNIDYENANNLYKGYVKIEDRLYVFIDVSTIDIEIPEQDVFSWVIIDEIVNKRVCNNIPICNMIVDLFLTNPLIKNIYNENNEPIETPICVYICENEEVDYVNVRSSSTLNVSLLSNKVQHSVFGNIAMFSTKQFQNDDQIYKRYCLFTSESVYILHSNFTKPEVSLIHDKSCIRFPYNDRECWSIKDSSLYSSI